MAPEPLAGLQATGPWMPGQVEDGERAFDTVQLLDALSTDATRAAGREAAGAEFTENTTLRVLRKETHLAVLRAPGQRFRDAWGAGRGDPRRWLPRHRNLDSPPRTCKHRASRASRRHAQLGAVAARSPWRRRSSSPRYHRALRPTQPQIDGAQQSGASSSLSFENATGRLPARMRTVTDGRAPRGEREASSQTSEPGRDRAGWHT